ncbi:MULTISPECIES: hypothetical protein [Streptomyces]|nr:MULTISPECIES: hypothetical protein [Streptomyces]MBI0381815.1 hypothetical protein [Streptomyces albiflaviniger]
MTPAEQRIYDLLTALSEAALGLASSAVFLARPSDGAEYGLKYMNDVLNMTRHVEALAVAVLRHSGVSWDALASYRGISRQSLHRRLAQRVDAVTDLSQKYPDMHVDRAYQEIAILKRVIERLDQNLEAELEKAAPEWRRRVHKPGWWWQVEAE